MQERRLGSPGHNLVPFPNDSPFLHTCPHSRYSLRVHWTLRLRSAARGLFFSLRRSAATLLYSYPLKLALALIAKGNCLHWQRGKTKTRHNQIWRQRRRAYICNSLSLRIKCKKIMKRLFSGGIKTGKKTYHAFLYLCLFMLFLMS